MINKSFLFFWLVCSGLLFGLLSLVTHVDNSGSDGNSKWGFPLVFSDSGYGFNLQTNQSESAYSFSLGNLFVDIVFAIVLGLITLKIYQHFRKPVQ